MTEVFRRRVTTLWGMENVVNPLVPAWYDVAWSSAALLVVAFTVLAFVSLVRAPQATGWRFVVWGAVIVFVPVLGALAWFVIGRVTPEGSASR